ncbi:hypothetical protein JAAARDRAFT_192277 [Jaapia argillacea MUCL 33604]|uniref:Uncharacterized protein n=1 Tax=Jaapia argillacea MUCL 33604 TaxID=933084 RepID=A0A067PYL2_9AGAM|nr:hypothetical protein JAAARDRAFT_192277 [Jaapia argillacea MUCL 33604]
MIGNPDFSGKFDYSAYQEFTPSGDQVYSNVMSSQWAYRKSTEIANNPGTHRAMLVPIILGADKTTVSVAMGQNDFHLVYMSIANPHNSVRHAHRDALIPVAFLVIPKNFLMGKDPGLVWTRWGIDTNVIPFTDAFPQADIYELLTPDLLHQMIKGTFKDHLVTWVKEYLLSVHPKAEAQRRMDDIDRRIAAVPAFPGLRRFPEGRDFKQWTGNDSKALMKVYLPAVKGHVPDTMVRCLAAFLDFCYIARRSKHDSSALVEMQDALNNFRTHRKIFEDVGIRDDGFSLPRQHALEHYVDGIKLFGSPNRLCSSITESKHIRAVKQPWRRSSRNQPLKQILRTNQRLDKMAAARAAFLRRGLLHGSVLVAALRGAGQVVDDDAVDEEDEGMGVEGPRADSSIHLSKKSAFQGTTARVAAFLHQPTLPILIRHFLFDQIYPDDELTSADVDLDDCPNFAGKVSIHYSARATFYAPNEPSGNAGMHSEIIRSNPSWRNQYARYDTVLVQNASTDGNTGMRGMAVGRVMAFLSFTHDKIKYPCTLVEWFLLDGDQPDPVTGMWVVKPEVVDGYRDIGLVHTDCIIRAVHLIAAYKKTFLPIDFHFSYSHDAFQSFYVNKWGDYHSHECIR